MNMTNETEWWNFENSHIYRSSFCIQIIQFILYLYLYLFIQDQKIYMNATQRNNTRKFRPWNFWQRGVKISNSIHFVVARIYI